MNYKQQLKKLLPTLSKVERKASLPYKATQDSQNTFLHGKTILITGAAKNIGKSIVIESANAGAKHIIAVDIDKNGLEALKEELQGLSPLLYCYECDISKTDEIEKLIELISQQALCIDILVNNAGIQKTNTKEFKRQDWQDTFDTNVFGPMLLTSKITSLMKKNKLKGSIIFITSIHQWTVRRYASYSASKSALGMIVQELAADLASNGIRVNGVAPGWISLNADEQPRFQEEALLHQQSIPPCYIARAVVYLAADYFSHHTTGTILKVDAGLSLYNHLTK